MSTAQFSSFYDVGDVLYQNRRNNQLKTQLCSDRKIIGTGMNNTSPPRNRNFSTDSSSAFVPVTGRACTTSFVPGPNSTASTKDDDLSPAREHKKLDRSLSEPIGSDRLGKNGTNINSSRYKTELCRPFEESGHCKYGDKCQFAHGGHELRNLARHPKYKTDLCRTFHTIGFCPYGPRCHFIHNEDERILSHIVVKNQQANCVQPSPIERPSSIKFNSLSSLGSSLDSPPSSDSGSASPTFFTDDIYNSVPFSSSGSGSGSSRSSPVFNSYSPVTALGPQNSMTAPLNVQTQLNNVNTLEILRLQQQFTSVMNFNEQNNHPSVFEDNFSYREINQCSSDVFCAPPSSPESISGDSVGSTGSGSAYSTCGSPLEVGKTLRLPIFNRLSQEN
ncbi:mRNA decay activator protein ZFP36L2-like [Gigantopelta aegis]|uniref:mRNA decay activator protein ZFP36L2-like n=1 Tax=Gigantopelta aegis TaxID=1735272 RepID=UPI001B887A16|nr:mRNA decay activator protein ZFP36L2-like [Gigantopelta aegis]